MRFAVDIIYLLQSFTYDITSEDAKHFTCTRKGAHSQQDSSAPPEELMLILGEEPKAVVWGKSLAELYWQLSERISEHLHSDNSDHFG